MIILAVIVLVVLTVAAYKSAKRRARIGSERPGASANRVVRTSLRDCARETL